MALIKPLVASELAVREADPRKFNLNTALPEVERAIITEAREKRRREFITGRNLAREAMADLGLPPQSIPASDHRAPIWPDGVVGSLSHTDELCVAVVARSESVRAVGVDVETSEQLDHRMLNMICTKAERSRLASKPEATALAEAKLIFSAKEAVFKALSPILRMEFIEFNAVTVTFEDTAWTATPEDRELEQRLDGQLLQGQWTEVEGLIGTLIAIR